VPGSCCRELVTHPQGAGGIRRREVGRPGLLRRGRLSLSAHLPSQSVQSEETVDGNQGYMGGSAATSYRVATCACVGVFHVCRCDAAVRLHAQALFTSLFGVYREIVVTRRNLPLRALKEPLWRGEARRARRSQLLHKPGKVGLELIEAR
jgi:hypothetical protein